ncbi:16S rRNA (uracil(1498)-N(3))-methyltransferase [Novosphingobium sp.]|uniref:16S rRNA (uracil(1498)-N(3))-methyltransferase n=1 Tax=Novosphingobium sp. TaxID=1874826 RepID=UPI0025E7189A|nr:16S rRNA (uracil(1498)-N(3))-methyltransferase [Novosphingobium sp.]
MTPAWPPKSAPRLFVESGLAEGASVVIEGPQAHYLVRVMRVATGDTVMLCDDVTGEWLGRVVSVDKRSVALALEVRTRPRETVPDLWLCAALLKKAAYDMVLEKACELGVARIVPVIAHRCVADKLNPERASAILTEAAEQCARTALPALGEVLKLDALLAEWPADRTLFFADENGGVPAAQAFTAHNGPAAILIGPEGGFDDGERAHIRAHACAVPIGLGPRILRGETAAIAALALWMGLAGDWPCEPSSARPHKAVTARS